MAVALVETALGIDHREMSQDVVERAMRLIEWSFASTREVFAANSNRGENNTSDAARCLTAVVKRGYLPTVTVREVHTALRNTDARYRTVQHIRSGLRALETAGYLRRHETKKPGRPSETYFVNPLIFQEPGHKYTKP